MANLAVFAMGVACRGALFVLGGVSLVYGTSPTQSRYLEAFEQADTRGWQEVFHDQCTDDWSRLWFLDGDVGVVRTTVDGMELAAGSEFRNDAHHMVLWTKESFSGDLRISYEYTRLDEETRCVNILYVQATGSGRGPYHQDIRRWSELRRVPSMRTYFDHMHTYHISYAAFPNDSDETSYIRGRRYVPEHRGLKGTELTPDHFPTGLFETNVPHRIEVIKTARDLFMRVKNDDRTVAFHMVNERLPVISEGRIGLRHMFTRSARYRDIRVSVSDGAASSDAHEPSIRD